MVVKLGIDVLGLELKTVVVDVKDVSVTFEVEFKDINVAVGVVKLKFGLNAVVIDTKEVAVTIEVTFDDEKVDAIVKIGVEELESKLDVEIEV